MSTRAKVGSSVMRQFLTLPIVLGSLLLFTGGIGVYIVRHSTTSLASLDTAGVRPTVALAEVASDLHELLENLIRINQVGISKQDQETLLQKSRDKLKTIGTSVESQVSNSKGQPYEAYLKKWADDWNKFQTQSTPLLASVQSIQPVIPQLDETITEMLDKMGNMNDFIQYFVKKVSGDQATFSRHSMQALSLILALGIIIGLISSILVVRSIRRLFMIVAEGKKNIEALLNNLDQGYFAFDKTGLVLEGVSKAAIKFLGIDPSGKAFHEVFPFNSKEQDDIKGWQNLVFSGALSFKDFEPLAPKSFEANGRYIELDFRPIYFEESADLLEKVICIASDKTEERRLREKAESEATLVKLVMIVLSDRASFVDFVLETRKTFVELEREVQKAAPRVDPIFRGLHTLKGGCAAFGILKVSRKAHKLENILGEIRTEGSKWKEFLPAVKAGISEMNAYFEGFLKENHNIFGTVAEDKDRSKIVSMTTIYNFCQMIFKQVGKESPLFANFLDRFVKEDMGNAFKRYESVVQGIAERQMKRVELKIDQGKAKVYIDPYLSLISSFVHVFRNSMDHGIEDEQTRLDAGKSETGSIEVKFEKILSERGLDYLRIIVNDDGGGINPAVVKNKALTSGLISQEQAHSITNDEIYQLLFMTGFSTRDEVSDLSGRGVGLDAVKFEASKLGGTAKIESVLGSGTTLTVEVPFYDSPVLSLSRLEEGSELKKAA